MINTNPSKLDDTLRLPTPLIGLDESLAYIHGREEFACSREQERVERLKNKLVRVPSLLPSDLEAKRLAIPICAGLPVRSNPRASAVPKPLLAKHQGAAELYLFKMTVLPNTISMIPGTDLLINDKLMPHALHDFMVISGRADVWSYRNLGQRNLEGLFRAAATFGQYCESTGLYPVVAFTCDPATKDRITAQGTGRFHAHFMGRTEEELRYIGRNHAPLETMGVLDRRNFVDEYTVLAATCLADRLPTSMFSTIAPIGPFSCEYQSPTLVLKVNGSWKSIDSSQFISELNTVIQCMEETYSTVGEIICSGASGDWKRPHLAEVRRHDVRVNCLDKARSLGWFRESTLSTIDHFLSRLSPRIVNSNRPAFQTPAFTRITSHLYPLRGMAYSLAISAQKVGLCVHITPTLFSDIGGAGMCSINGTVTRINKGAGGSLSAIEAKERADFQANIVEALRR